MKPATISVPFLWICVAAQVQFSPAQRQSLPQPDQTGKASIEGSVLDAVTREPVKKASVTLNGRGSLNAVTDASGHFAFRQLPAGQYNLFARSERYPQAPGQIDTGQQLSISIAADEQKQDIRLSLIPGALIHGRIVDEDGNAMPHCYVNAMQFRNTGNGRAVQQISGSSQSDDNGEYRISNLPRGKYYIEARCNQMVPLPHAFVRRASATDLPSLAYAPLLYPGAADLAVAAKVDAAPGVDISGIDFHMAPQRAFTVRGHVGGADRNIQLNLAPTDSVRPHPGRGARVNPSTGEFQIANVLPGSYELIGFAFDEGRSAFGKVSVEVGATPPEPIDLTLAPAPAINGSLSIEGDVKVPMNAVRVMMNPLASRPMMGPQPQAAVQSDGTFTLNPVMPGHWRLHVNGAPGYVKSVKEGDRDVTPWDLEIGTSPVQLKIVIGTKFAQVEASLAAQAAGNEPITAILWAANGDPGIQQTLGMNPQSPTTISVQPGRYYACAFATAQPWMLMQNSVLRKALESHCETVEAAEGGTARVQVPLVPTEDVKQLVEKIDQ